jgi:hypothetical protein
MVAQLLPKKYIKHSYDIFSIPLITGEVAYAHVGLSIAYYDALGDWREYMTEDQLEKKNIVYRQRLMRDGYRRYYTAQDVEIWILNPAKYELRIVDPNIIESTENLVNVYYRERQFLFE